MLDNEKDAELIGRLINWKFGAAAGHIRDDHPKHVRDAVCALGSMFGSCGWIDGVAGDLIGAVVGLLVPPEQQQ